MQKITKKLALELLKKAVERKGKDHTASCVYLHPNGRACCIVGHVLKDAGASNEQLRLLAGSTISAPYEEVQSLPITNVARRILRRAQEVQDSGKTWGEALAAARMA